MGRKLYLATYDISEPSRLEAVSKIVKGYATGGQKSVRECWMTASEFRYLKWKLSHIFNPEEDRIYFFQLDPRLAPKLFGRAEKTNLDTFLII